MMKIGQLILLNLALISVKCMIASQKAPTPTKRRTSESPQPSAEIRKLATNGLSASSEKLERATIRGYGNPNGGSMHGSDKELTFHNIFYGV